MFSGFVLFAYGGDEGGRTPYLLNAIQALYQLSYTPKADNKRKYTIFTSFCQLHLNKWVKMFCADGAVPRKLKKLITSNYKMSMSTNSANNCVYNKTAHINKQ